MAKTNKKTTTYKNPNNLKHRYLVIVGGQVESGRNRIDHAKKQFQKLVNQYPEAGVSLEDTKTKKTVYKTMSGERPSSRRRSHHNGDAVGVATESLDAQDMQDMVRAMLDLCAEYAIQHKVPFFAGNPNRWGEELDKIKRAAERKNKGSGKMSLSLMLRKYLRFLGVKLKGATTVNLLQDAQSKDVSGRDLFDSYFKEGE